MEVLPLPGATSKHPLTLPPPPASLACPAQNKAETYTQQVSYRPNPKSTTTTTTKFQTKSCLLLSSEAFNSYFGLLLCVTHQIVTLQISVISAFSVFSDFSLLYLPVSCLFLLKKKKKKKRKKEKNTLCYNQGGATGGLTAPLKVSKLGKF